ncbi:M-phase phosphoprotein 8 isoform X1 [Hippocampus zosterae]|uniref:M-phase phosphoprotein 8 isoform X1 n=1 Tax=Hippocampus zosterae TaxID=109293 RepID=UPI00223D6D87|nr:M-phase phosphoprotein 8 isoform X1 [Hippocampus zosterae]
MDSELQKMEPVDSEQDEEENVYEVERIIDMRVEEGEVLYRVRWKGYCSDDDTWEPEGHLEDCREVLLAYKKAATEIKKEPEERKPILPLPTKSDVFDADSESDSDKDQPTNDVAVIKKKKKKFRELEDEEEGPPRKEKKKKKKKDKWRDEVKPLPAPETDEDDEKTAETKKHMIKSENEDEAPPKKSKKEITKDGKLRKDRGGEEPKKKKTRREYSIASSDEDLSEGLSDSSARKEKPHLDEHRSKPKQKPDGKLKGTKDLTQDKKSKLKESSLLKLKSLTASKIREDAGPPSSDSSDSSGLHRKGKSKSQEAKAAAAAKPREDETAREDGKGSTNLFETFLQSFAAKDRAPRRLPADKSANKPSKVLGKIEKIKPVKESPTPKEPERTEKSKQPEAVPRPGQGYGFSLDSDELEGENPSSKPRTGDDSRERREKPEESQTRPGWERKGPPAEDRKKKREDGESRPLAASDDHVDQQPMEPTDKSDKAPATLSLGMDLNLDWMTLDDFQKHLNGDDEILSGPPLSPSELRDAVKSGDYVAVKLALNSKEEYNLDQEACTTVVAKRSFDERSPRDGIFMSHFLNGPQENRTASVNENLQKDAPESEGSSGQGPETLFESPFLNGPKEGKTASGNENLQKDVPESEGSSGQGPETLESEGPKDGHSDRTAGGRDRDQAGETVEPDGHEETTDSASISSKETITDDGKAPKSCQRKTTKAKEPTRSSKRMCRKVVRPESSVDEEEEKEKEACKKHFCFYCQMPFSHLEKHLEKKHGKETDVSHAIHFPKGSKVRQTLLDQIRDNGNYEQRAKTLQKGGDEDVVTQTEVKTAKICVRDFLPCQHCFTFYRKTDLWRHEHSCKARKADDKSSEIPNVKTAEESPTSLLLPRSEFLTDGCREIIHTMHQDDIARHIVHDPLICKFGSTLLAKYGHDKSQFAYIGQKMRQLGRFMIAINELDGSVRYLHQLCLPSRFELAVEGAKKASGFDPTCSRFKTFSLVSKIGYSLKRAAEIAFGESRMTEDTLTEGEVRAFIQLLDTKWSERFSRRSLAPPTSKTEVDSSGVTEDLIKLHRFIADEGDEARRELRHNPSVANWKKLSEATLADVCLFNRTRVGNIGRLLLQTYASKKLWGAFVPSADQIKKCTKLELEVCGHFTRVELEGQFGRNMLVLLTENMTLSLDLLVENRQDAGVSRSNPYLFARTEGHSFIRGLDCFRRAALECGVRNPEALLSPALREQIACCWQLMSLRRGQLERVAGLLGKSSQECFALSTNASLLEEASKHLLQLDRTPRTIPANVVGNGMPPKAAPKRRPWSECEQAAVKHRMSDFIRRMKVPGKKDCNACIAAEADLAGRSWTDVKNYVHNSIQTMRRRSKQHKEAGKGRASKPKKRIEEVQRRRSDDASAGCSLSSGLPDHLRESSNCCMAPPPQEPNPYAPEMPLSYMSLCSPNANLIHASQPLMSTLTPLNATDTQVVPTFTPLSTTSALMSPVYASETDSIHPMAPPYSPNTSNMPGPVYADPLNPPMLPAFDVPSTSMLPTFTTLNSPSSPMVPAFSPAFSSTFSDRSEMMVSSFTALNPSTVPSYPTSQPRTSMSAQVVPTVHGGGIPDEAAPTSSVQQKSSRKQTPSTTKPQKRHKRLWSTEEQAAVRRQFGDLCKLAKVPGKKDCDSCLAAEPALNSRTWREVKYFVHNNIQSMKRRGLMAAPPKVTEERKQELETTASNAECDGPVYLSL